MPHHNFYIAVYEGLYELWRLTLFALLWIIINFPIFVIFTLNFFIIIVVSIIVIFIIILYY